MITRETKVIAGDGEQLWCAAFDPDGELIATCGTERVVRIWQHNGKEWVCVAALEDAQRKTIRCVSWDPTGSALAASSFDGTTVLWVKVPASESESLLTSFELRCVLEGHENEVKCVAWSNADGGELIATCSRDKSIWLWKVTDLALTGEVECLEVLYGHAQDVKYVAWHPCVNVLASASYDNTVRIWKEDDDGDWYCAETLEGHSSTVWCVQFDKSGSRMASCSDDRSVIVWGEDENGGWTMQEKIQTSHTRTIFSIAWSHLSDILFTCGGDNRICLYARSDSETHSFKEVHVEDEAHELDVNCVALSRKSPLLASVDDGGCLSTWRIVQSTT